MQITIEQAAEMLGKTRRQIGYLIKHGKLKAIKVGGRWRIELDDLPLSAGQQEARERKRDQLVQAIEDTLDVGPRRKRRRYSIKDLRAFQIAAPLYHKAIAALGREHPGCIELHRSLKHLSRGCHRFSAAAKVECYLEARDAASEAACDLALEPDAAAAPFVECIEQELMAAIVGLVRRLDCKDRKDRKGRKSLEKSEAA